MKEFTANKPDLDLKITTIHDEEVEVKGRYLLSAAKSEEIMRFFNKVEEAYEKEKDSKKETRKSGIDLVADELEYVYDKDAQWFKDNIDLGLMNEILVYAAGIIGGLLKK